MTKTTAIGKKEIFQFGLLMGFFFLGYYMWTQRNILSVKRGINNMPENLQAIFKILKEKDYNPETSPTSFTGYFIKFTSSDVQVLINSKETITFIYDPTKPPYIAEYSNGVLTGKNAIIADNDIVSAILQTIENKDYK